MYLNKNNLVFFLVLQNNTGTKKKLKFCSAKIYLHCKCNLHVYLQLFLINFHLILRRLFQAQN